MGRTGTGVELREKSIRIGFKYEGEWCREPLNWDPTPANEKRAIKLVENIRRRIAAGTFDYAEFFPDSKRAASSRPATKTFGQACASYLASIGHLTAASRDQYTNAIENVWKPLIGPEMAFDSITHDYLASRIGAATWTSAKSRNNYLIPLRGVFDLHYRGKDAVHNPMAGITNKKVVRKRPDPLTPDERDKILADMSERCDERIWAYFAFAFFTGLRPEEQIALRWGDVDLASGVIRIQRVRTFRGSEREGSKTHTERDVDLTDPALRALQVMRPWTYMKGDDADIFQNPVTKQPWHDERSQRDTYWKPCLRRLGIRARRAYATRHTYCTAALMAGIRPAYIAAQAGHSLKMLLEVYARWIPGADGGSEKEKLRAAFSNGYSSPEFPRQAGSGNEKAGNPLISNRLPASDVGRRDWTRTSSRRKR